MGYFFYNNDAQAFADSPPVQRLISRGYAVTADNEKYAAPLRRVSPDDTILMYHDEIGIVAVGTSLEQWDEIQHVDNWFYGTRGNPTSNFRIGIDWYLDFTENPIHFDELRGAIGYIPRGAMRRDRHKNNEIEDLIASHFSTGRIPPKRKRKPGRTERIVDLIDRDTGLARTIKRMHRHRCQVCGQRIKLPSGGFYSEAHHIKPLGRPHNGDDHIDNIMCVCPNHHAMLDRFALRLDHQALRKVDGHVLANSNVKYHNTQCDAAGLP